MNLVSLKEDLSPYKGVISFFVVMMLSNLLWKLSISGFEEGKQILLWKSFDITWIFEKALTAVCTLTNFVLRDILGMHYSFLENNVIHFGSGFFIQIVWECSGIKQIFIFTLILLFSFGSWKNKLWFIPLGACLCFFLNVLRVIILTEIVYAYPNLFVLFHSYILKYGFYFVVFMYWIWWNESFSKK